MCVSVLDISHSLARDAFVRPNRRSIPMTFVRPPVCLSVCLSKTSVHCDHMVHVITHSVCDWYDRHVELQASGCRLKYANKT